MNGADCPPRDDGSDNPAVAKAAVTIIAIVAVWAVATEAMVAAGWLRIPGLAVAVAAVLVASSAVGAAVVLPHPLAGSRPGGRGVGAGGRLPGFGLGLIERAGVALSPRHDRWHRSQRQHLEGLHRMTQYKQPINVPPNQQSTEWSS